MIIEINRTSNNLGRIIFEYFDAYEQLRDHFSTVERNHMYVKRCRQKGIKIQPSKEYIKKSCIKMSGEFEIGLLQDILAFVKNTFYDRSIKFKLDDGIKEYIQSNDLVLDTKNIYIDDKGSEVRPYQKESMQIALNKQNGIYILGTGAGKTVCCALLIRNILKNKLARKVLLVCPFPDLANQTFNDISSHLKNFKYSISKWFSNIPFDKKSQVVICGASILRAQYDDLKKEIQKFDCIIIDEVHSIKANNKISKIIADLPAKLRYGFTGTLPHDKHDKWSILGKIGPVRFELPSAELRKDKFLTQVSTFGINIRLKDIPTYVLDDEGIKRPFGFMEETEWLSNNDQFNSTITSIVSKLSNNTLILVNRIIHGENLLQKFKEADPNRKVYFIQGEVPIEERTDIKEQLEKENNILLIAQASIFSTGINIKNLHNIVFPGLIGKSNVRIIQSIGRILRLKENKTLARVIDIIPNTKYALRHKDERIKLYEQEKIPFKIIGLKT